MLELLFFQERRRYRCSAYLTDTYAGVLDLDALFLFRICFVLF